MAATATDATAVEDKVTCYTEGCDAAASMSCPTCIKLKVRDIGQFCTQSCFTGFWKQHTKAHAYAKAVLKHVPPSFAYTSALRPGYVSPMRDVPADIPAPDYAKTSQPTSELELQGSTKIEVLTKEEIDGVRKACQIGRAVLDMAGAMVRPGVTTEEIDIAVHEMMIRLKAYPSPLNYHGFPKSCCTSVNEVICHGIPDSRPLQDGDILNIDITAYYGGYHGDLNETFTCGTVDDESKRLIKTTYDSMMAAIATVKPGTYCRDFGNIITDVVSKQKFSVVRTYCGHGIHRLFHCAPSIPHYARNKAVGVLREGMVLTIEPMINVGGWKDVTWFDEWTSVTADGKRSAQFEHTMVVTATGVEILTARTKDSIPFWWDAPEEKARLKAEAALAKAAEGKARQERLNKQQQQQSANAKSGQDLLDDGFGPAPTTGGSKNKKKKKKKK